MPNLVCKSRPKVYTYRSNFIWTCSLCRLTVAKKQFWANLDTFGGSYTDPLLPMRAKFGVLEQTQGLHLQAKFHLNVFIVSASSVQKPQFLANFDFLGASVPTPFYRLGPNVVCYSRPKVYAYTSNFVSIGLFCRLLLAKTPNFCRFWTSAFSVVANWQQSDKVEHGCTTTNLPLSKASKSFLYSNAFMAKSDAQSLTFKSVTNRQTNKKNSTFLATRRRVKSQPHQTWHGDRGPRARSFTSKTFGGLTHSFAASGR